MWVAMIELAFERGAKPETDLPVPGLSVRLSVCLFAER
jgi:hypothetical protein